MKCHTRRAGEITEPERPAGWPAAPQAQLQSSAPRFTCTSFPGSADTTPGVKQQSSERQWDNNQPTTKLSFHQLDDLDADASGASLPGLGNAGPL